MPPAVLAHDDTRIDIGVEQRSRPHRACLRLDAHPVSRRDAAPRRGFRMQHDLRIHRAPAQTRQRAVLGLAEQRGLGAGQHKRVTIRVWSWWRYKFRHRRIALRLQRLRPELHFARGCGEAARIAPRVRFGVLGVAGGERHADAPRLGPQGLQAQPAGRQLVTVGRLNIPVPEMLAQSKPDREIEDDVGVGPGRTRRRRDRLAELHQAIGPRR